MSIVRWNLRLVIFGVELPPSRFSSGKPIFLQLSLGGLRIMSGSLFLDEVKLSKREHRCGLSFLSGTMFC